MTNMNTTQESRSKMEDFTTDGYFSDDAATLGDRIAAGREALGFSQKDLARLLGVKLKTIQSWENDRTEPRANKAQMLSGVLGVSLIWLLTGEGEGVPEPTEIAALPESVKDILDEMRVLKSDMSKAARKLSSLEKRLRAAL